MGVPRGCFPTPVALGWNFLVPDSADPEKQKGL